MSRTSGYQSCSHSAFQHHVLFFASPQSRFLVGFKWEHVNLWKLQPPYFPFWDEKTRALIPTRAQLPDANQPGSGDLLRRLSHIVQMSFKLVSCILCTLSRMIDDLDDLPGDLPSWVASFGGTRVSLPACCALAVEPSTDHQRVEHMCRDVCFWPWKGVVFSLVVRDFPRVRHMRVA